MPESAAVTPTRLLGNHPNPFNPASRIDFVLAEGAQVRLAIHDVQGRLVTVLKDGYLARGVHSLTWRGCDAAGRIAASGVYLSVLDVNGSKQSERMILLK